MFRTKPAARRTTPWLALLAPLAPGCIDDGEVGYKTFCRNLCDMAAECSAGGLTPVELRQCQRECMTEPSHQFVQEEVFLVGAECLATRSCNADAVLQLSGAEVWSEAAAKEACWAEGTEEVGATDACEAFCDDFVTARNACGAGVSTADCRGHECAFEATFLDRLAECAAVEDCEEQNECFERVYD